MVLNFFGRGSGFADEHTSAYFATENNEMVIIDCPASTFFKLKKMDLSSYEKLYVLVTHTHADHIGCLGLFVQYAYFTLKKPVVVVAPSEEVAKDIATLFRIEGNHPSWCTITVDDVWENDWFGGLTLTEHSPQLESKCFGYYLIIDNTHVIYTGDTATLDPFRNLIDAIIVEESLKDESERKKHELYVDTSVYYGMIHLKLEDALDELKELAENGIKVYLMHLDDIDAAERIIKDIPNIEVVPII